MGPSRRMDPALGMANSPGHAAVVHPQSQDHAGGKSSGRQREGFSQVDRPVGALHPQGGGDNVRLPVAQGQSPAGLPGLVLREVQAPPCLHRRGRFAGSRPVVPAIGSPRNQRGQCARPPRTAEVVVEGRMDQLNARTAAARCGGPGKPGAVTHFIHHRSGRVPDLDAIATVLQHTDPGAQRRESVFGPKLGGILRDHPKPARGNAFARRKHVLDAVLDPPAGQVHLGGTCIVQFNELLLPGGIRGIILDFVDHHLGQGGGRGSRRQVSVRQK